MWPDVLRLVDESRSTPQANLALDEALLLAVEQGQCTPCLRLWQCPTQVVVLGTSSRVGREVHLDRCRSEGIGVLRRCTGGGVVLLGPGCLVFSLVLPVRASQRMGGVRAATASILDRCSKALRRLVPGVSMCGTSDLAVGGQKVGGSAQRWLRRSMLHHGTLLYDFPIHDMSHYLKMPAREPDYRAGRPHDAFVTNLPASDDQLRRALAEAWGAAERGGPLPDELAEQLVRDKYSTDAWNLRW